MLFGACEDLMRRFAMKALFAALALDRFGRRRIDWGRKILIFSTAVTLALVALYIWGKTSARW